MGALDRSRAVGAGDEVGDPERVARPGRVDRLVYRRRGNVVGVEDRPAGALGGALATTSLTRFPMTATAGTRRSYVCSERLRSASMRATSALAVRAASTGGAPSVRAME